MNEPQTVVIGGRVRALRDLARPLTVRGLVAIAAGLIALAWPSEWIVAVTMILGGGTFVVGVTELGDAVRRRRNGTSCTSEIVRGLGAVGAGLFLMVYPERSVELLAYVLGGLWVGYGLLEVLEGVRHRRTEREGRLRVGRGLVALAAGATVLVWPDPSASLLSLVLGAMLVVLGVLSVAAGRSLHRASLYQPVVRLEVVNG